MHVEKRKKKKGKKKSTLNERAVRDWACTLSASFFWEGGRGKGKEGIYRLFFFLSSAAQPTDLELQDGVALSYDASLLP